MLFTSVGYARNLLNILDQFLNKLLVTKDIIVLSIGYHNYRVKMKVGYKKN